MSYTAEQMQMMHNKILQELISKTKDTGWIEATLVNGKRASYTGYRKVGNTVYLRGKIKDISATGTVLFYLPEEYIPEQSCSIVCGGNGSNHGLIGITNSGSVILNGYSANIATGNLVHLDGISFVV